MANEVTHSLLQTNGGQTASFLSSQLRPQLYDPTDLRAICTYTPFEANMGSDTMDVTKDAVPGAAAAASSEISGGGSNSAYTTGRFSHAVARYLRFYQWSDLPGITGGPISSNVIMANLLQGVSLTYTDLITALFPALTAGVDTTGVALDVDGIYDCQFALNANSVPGPYYVVLYPTQFNHFQESLRSVGGAHQWQPATAEMLAAKGPGYKGSWNGIEFWQADSVTAVNTAADSSGAMFGQGAFEWTYGPVGGILQNINPGDVMFATPEMFIERSRDAENGLTRPILNFYPGVVTRETARAVEIITKRAA